MKPKTHRWLERARYDYATMLRENRVQDDPNFAVVCFLAQQCVEKLMKGYLFEHGISFPKTHDLRRLIELAEPLQPGWLEYGMEATKLTMYAVEARYPDDILLREDAEEAVMICSKLRLAILEALQPDDQLNL